MINSSQTGIYKDLLLANPSLSKFNPLRRILFYDDFDNGYNGWVELVGNHPGDLTKIKKAFSDLRPVMLSNLTFYDCGTHGSMEGTYALKLATKAKEGHKTVAIKRVTWSELKDVQFEAYFTYKPEGYGGLEKDIRAFGVMFDIQDNERRWHPTIRYLNSKNGEIKHFWQYHKGIMPTSWDPNFVDIFGEWADIANSHQPLCYNETDTKVNWHYLRILIDTDKGKIKEFQCNDKLYDMNNYSTDYRKTFWGLRNLLNVCFFIEADSTKRCFFYVDSCLMSVDW